MGMKKVFLIGLVFIILLTLIVTNSSKKLKPSPKDAVSMFFFKQDTFNKLSTLVCSMGNEKQEFSTSANSFLYKTSEIEEDLRVKELDDILATLGALSIHYHESEAGECEIDVYIVSTGFAGSAQTQIFKYNQNIDYPFDEESFPDAYEILNKESIYRFDMALINNWHFSYKVS
tara:strand:+ start:853 stop:1374 length:522 start_codon:yes stop_codon:yes gene_type:complete